MYHNLITEKSWQILKELKNKYNFILIGGWAVYLYTQNLKSKDIDLVISFDTLSKIKKDFDIVKNARLKKYEIKKDEIDIDIYLEYYSKLAIPVEVIKKFAVKIEGFQVASPELLLILKQAAYKDRENSVKGEKDKIDIVSLLFFAGINFDKYREILKKYSLSFDLKNLLKNFKNYNSLSFSPGKFKKIKSNLLLKI